MEKSERYWKIAAISFITALPFYAICTATHVCRGGHLQHIHPGISLASKAVFLLHLTNDVIWGSLFVITAIAAPASKVRGSLLLTPLLLFVVVSRFVFGSLGGYLALYEIPILVILIVAVAYISDKSKHDYLND